MDRELPISELPNVLNSLKKKRKDFHTKASALLTDATEASKCSFDQGEITQEVFRCVTCTKEGEMAGVCVGCYLSCHLQHDVQELGYKASFRCDCGNSKFAARCALLPEKPSVNAGNVYNHNFLGRFCFCDTPDSEDQREDDLFMCVGCQDWFHQECIQKANDCHNFAEVAFHQKTIPGIPDDSAEFHFLCVKCVDKARFLPWTYPDSIFYREPTKRPRPQDSCPLANHPPFARFPYNVFLREAWLTDRCACESCQQRYKEPPFSTFLVEEQTNVLKKLEEAAESTLLSQGDEPTEPKEEDDEELKEFLDSVQTYPHSVQVELAHGVKLFQDTFSEFIGRFQSGGVLCEEHIEEFKRELADKYEAYKRTKRE